MRKPYYILYIILLLLLTACGSNTNTSSDSGAVSFKIKLARPATANLTSYLTGNDICIDYGVATVTAIVTDSSGKAVASGSWSCSLHHGTITGIPAGNNYTVNLQGKDSNSTVTWSGEKTGISIRRGTTTSAGTIAMTYVGSDTTAPTVTSTSPSDSTPTVPVTTLLTATFSEKMAISSVNTNTFKLTNGPTPVSGSVTYDSNTKKAIFIPATNLSYSTTYTATITTGVEDMAGKNMEADKTWSFTTEVQPTSAPSVPTGVKATAGNGQATITWDAVAGATSYNIYWSTTASITKGTGTKISGVTSPYIHTGRTNGTTYYYVVT
ncbi:MAG: Ig-like domain-containing protein, partial [Nitrospira sp.]|nr:Ig-like domain-containing protein [Nitrospira sp.]